MRFFPVIFFMCVIWHSSVCYALVSVEDDRGNLIQLEAPAQRIISLAPHITELLFEAGADKQLIATVEYSDYPPTAKKIRRIGSFNKFDFEAIAALQPDLVIAWYSGNPAEQVQAIQQLGVPVFFSEPRKLQDVARDIEKFGMLLGTPSVAVPAAQKFLSHLHYLREKYKNRKPVSVFYEVWNRPLMTVNGQHIINDVIQLCGGRNVFAELAVIAPQVDIESVLKRNPQVIIAGINESRQGWLQEWRQWPSLFAVSQQHVYGVDPDLITRHTSRILMGAQQVCDFIENARE